MHGVRFTLDRATVRQPRQQVAAGQPARLVLRNIGVMCGAVSENLVVIDFDGPGGYPAFAASFPHLTETLTVATGGGIGRHVYLLVDHLPPTTTAKQTSIGSIELRSTGSYV
ncbi:MAG: bifunctional DNA primase/polymerase, partial [Anaerolineae bacterium]|nr:bifunctional DNA primase/polymerase [Anaerolineae bacterium]